MKQILLLLFLSAAAVFAADQPATTPAVKPLTELQREKLLRLQAQTKEVNERYQAEIAPLQAEMQAIAADVCASAGVPKDKLSECRTDVTPEEKYKFGKVWREIPPPTPAAKPEEKK